MAGFLLMVQTVFLVLMSVVVLLVATGPDFETIDHRLPDVQDAIQLALGEMGKKEKGTVELKEVMQTEVKQGHNEWKEYFILLHVIVNGARMVCPSRVIMDDYDEKYNVVLPGCDTPQYR